MSSFLDLFYNSTYSNILKSLGYENMPKILSYVTLTLQIKALKDQLLSNTSSREIPFVQGNNHLQVGRQVPRFQGTSLIPWPSLV